MPLEQSAMVQCLPGQTATSASAPGDHFLANRTVSDTDDPDLGVASMEEDDATGGGGGGAGGFSGGGLGEWPDDKAGACSLVAPTAAAGALKRRANVGLFGSWPKKVKISAAATKRQEAAARATLFQKGPKPRPLVSG